jgi:hypothetical protein
MQSAIKTREIIIVCINVVKIVFGVYRYIIWSFETLFVTSYKYLSLRLFNLNIVIHFGCDLILNKNEGMMSNMIVTA